MSEKSSNEILEGKKRSTAQRRWRILAKALIGTVSEPISVDPENEISVRRFTSFDLLRVNRLEGNPTADPDSFAAWYEYSTVLDNKLFTIEIRRRTKRNFTANELIGFNNTGNICVWPSEECLAYYLLKNRHLCRNRRVLELGGGMSCLAGMLAAKYCDPKEIALTDGNVTSVNNVRRIISRNGMSDFVECGVVQWAKAARAIRAARSVRPFLHPHPNALRVKVNYTSRVLRVSRAPLSRANRDDTCVRACMRAPFVRPFELLNLLTRITRLRTFLHPVRRKDKFQLICRHDCPPR